MPEPARGLGNLLYPALLFVVLGLYVAAIAAGVGPEIAMLRSGLVGVMLAFVGRFATGMLDNLPPTVPVEEENFVHGPGAWGQESEPADPRSPTLDPTSTREKE